MNCPSKFTLSGVGVNLPGGQEPLVQVINKINAIIDTLESYETRLAQLEADIQALKQQVIV